MVEGCQHGITDNKKKLKEKIEDAAEDGEKRDILIYHELFKILCFQYKIVSILDFLDNLDVYLIDGIIDNIPYLDRNNWEQTRLLASIQANTWSEKEVDPMDIIKFKWDDDSKKKEAKMIKTSDIERLKEKAKIIQQNFFNK